MTRRGRSKKIGVLKHVELVKEQANQELHHIDVLVGYRLKMAREIRGVSQDQLGKAVGLTFQQIQKYERGVNRISCSRLWEFSKLLDVKMAYFFYVSEDASALYEQQIILLNAFNKVEDKGMAIEVIKVMGDKL